jgi:hypothetical protein
MAIKVQNVKIAGSALFDVTAMNMLLCMYDLEAEE